MLFICLHTYSPPNPLPFSTLVSNASVKLPPQDLCTCSLLSLQSPACSVSASSGALLKSHLLCEAPQGTLFKVASPHPFSLGRLVTISPTLYFLTCILFGVCFPLQAGHLPTGEVFGLVCCLLCPQHPEECQASSRHSTDRRRMDG